MNEIDETIKSINERLGSVQVVRAANARGVGMRRFSTGILGLDIICGAVSVDEWGIPTGRISEIWGAKDSGKTTIALNTIASCQKLGFCGAFISLEGSWDSTWAEKVGIDLKNVVLCRVSTAEQAENVLYDLVATPGVGVIVVDSTAALTTISELETDTLEKNIQPGTQARTVNRVMRHVTAAFNRWPIDDIRSVEQQPAVIFLNQLRERLSPYGDPAYSPGGKGKEHYSSIIIRTATGEILRKDKDSPAYAVTLKCRTNKNKTWPGYQAIEYSLYLRNMRTKNGVIHTMGTHDYQEQLMKLSEYYGIVKRSGASYSYNETNIRGKDAFKSELYTNPELAAEIESKIKQAAFSRGGL